METSNQSWFWVCNYQIDLSLTKGIHGTKDMTQVISVDAKAASNNLNET